MVTRDILDRCGEEEQKITEANKKVQRALKKEKSGRVDTQCKEIKTCLNKKKASISTDSFLEIYTVFDNAFIAPKSLNMFALDNTLTLELQPLDFSNDIDSGEGLYTFGSWFPRCPTETL